MPRFYSLPKGMPPVCRLGLATRGNTALTRQDVWLALERGINYWNWCEQADGMSAVVRELGPRRKDVVVATQLSSRGREGAKRELATILTELGTHYLDCATFYYVEQLEEWRDITGRDGALSAMKEAQQQGRVRLIGLTTHQRSLAEQVLRSRLLDLVMVRYNAAHRRAESTLFPLAQELKTPLITFTSLRWKALLESTPDDPRQFRPPPARDWYRFALCQPAVAIVLMAPGNGRELRENLELLDNWRSPTPAEYEELCQHGERVRRHASRFP